MLRAVLTACVFLILGFAPESKPRPAADSQTENCSDDRGIDRCQPEQQRRVRELFGVEPIEAHRDAGDQVRRAFYVDGYGRDVVAITFIRPKGGDPSLWVHFPDRNPGRPPEPLRAAVPLGVWNEVVERSSHFDRTLARSPAVKPASRGDQVITMCLHSWVYTIEASDPADAGGRPATVRRKTEDACDNGLGKAYADGLQKAAVSLLPHCDRLDPSQHRNEATLLSDCRLLRGDRLAAAEVMNRMHSLRSVDGPKDGVLINGLFDSDAQIIWAGEKFATFGGAADHWAKKIGEGQGRTTLFYDYIEGESAARVRFVGSLARTSADGTYRTARVEQIWVRKHDDFVINSATVGPFLAEP
jgi:hypothetical protein